MQEDEQHSMWVLAYYAGNSLKSEFTRALAWAGRPLALDEVVATITAAPHTVSVQRSEAKGMLARLSHDGVVEVDRIGRKRFYSIAPAWRLATWPEDEFSLGITDISQQINTVGDLGAVLVKFGVQDAPASRILQVAEEVANERNQRLRQLDEDIANELSTRLRSL